jgi:adenylate kinase
MKDILLFGIQWSGKGTQGQLLAEAFPELIAYFASGDIFRALTSTPNAIGDYLKNRLASGQLIDNNVTNALFELYLHSVIDDDKAMLLDGYPRSIEQLEMMLDVCKEYNRDMVAIHFDLDEPTAIERMKARGRNDDTDESIAKRIKQYYEITVPMLELWEKSHPVIHINASWTIEEIHAEVIKYIHKN